MTPQDYEALQARLRSLADPAYQAFQQKLVPDVTNLLGVRVPALRQLARELVRGDWRGYLEAARHDTYEETMLQGLVLGCARMEQNELFARLAAFVPHIDNWAVCDVTCGGLRVAGRCREQAAGFLTPYLSAPREFDVRFGVVMLMDHFIDEAYIDRVLEWLAGVRHEGYYAKMGVAWALSVCFIKFPRRTAVLLESGRLDEQTLRMAAQKLLDSTRVGAEVKAEIRARRADRKKSQ